jgi:hypothetical protein
VVVPLIRSRTDGSTVALKLAPVGAERAVSRNAQFVAALPPTMLPDDDPGGESQLIIQRDAGARRARRCLDRDPVPSHQAESRSRKGVDLDLGMRVAFAQTWRGAMLGLAEECRLGASQYQRERAATAGAATGPICGSMKRGKASWP